MQVAHCQWCHFRRSTTVALISVLWLDLYLLITATTVFQLILLVTNLPAAFCIFVKSHYQTFQFLLPLVCRLGKHALSHTSILQVRRSPSYSPFSGSGFLQAAPSPAESHPTAARREPTPQARPSSPAQQTCRAGWLLPGNGMWQEVLLYDW